LPVSAMIHVPHAQDVFIEAGQFASGVDKERWQNYFGRTFRQLTWWSEAAKNQRAVGNPTDSFNRNPTQRNAP